MMEEKKNEQAEEIKEEVADTAETKKKKTKKPSECEELKKELEAAKTELKELNEKYVRMLAEYDNFRRRSQKERETVYTDAYSDAISEILPVLDNLERAAQFSDGESVQKGVQMTLRSLTDLFAKLGITEIETKTFDPAYHNAVFHVEDEAYGEGEIVEVLQKGYIKGDKVIRYAMVKVAN